MAVVRIVSPNALRAGFTFRGFGELPVFTIGIRDGEASLEPFAADIVWDPSIRLEGGESAGTDRAYVVRAALEFVEKATASLRVTLEAAAEDDAETEVRQEAPAAEPQAPPPVHDPTPLHLDTPATVDHLNRRGFARALAIRLDRIWREMNPKTQAKARRQAPRGSFVLHLHGEWGSPGSSQADPLRENVRRQVAVEHLAKAAVERSVTFFLQPFAPLLEPNPRSMKRFLNAYAIQRDLSILAGQDVLAEERWRKKLALWVILSLRWPGLGERLLEEREAGNDPLSQELAALRTSDEVRAIVNHLGPEDPLTLDDVAGLLGTAVLPDQISAPR